MILSSHVKGIIRQLLPVVLISFTTIAEAGELGFSDCRPLKYAEERSPSVTPFSNALLWQVSKPGETPSHIFGTIHVSDPRITELPEAVSKVLNQSQYFVMEALPDEEQLLRFSQKMYFTDGKTLRDFVSEPVFNKTADILAKHQFTPDMVLFLKPWAAFMLMNYPPDEGLPMDLQLLNTAMQNGAEVSALESLEEQAGIFGGLSLDAQLRFMLDSVCHYESIEREFEVMKSHYLNRDLDKLYLISHQYSVSHKALYQDFIDRLLTERNYTMVQRMQSVLSEGSAFIAIGAMHLPGPKGVLSLLVSRGYVVSPVY